jgi:RNA polymerase sigma-70 factor (ECF subfamily)
MAAPVGGTRVSTLAIDGALPAPIDVARIDVDGQLLEALRRHDSTAAERLVARYGARAYRLAMGITRNAADAEEVVQDAFWSVIRKIDTFRGDAAFGSWLYRIVANAAFQKVRRSLHRRTEISLDEVLPTFHEDSAAPPLIDDWSERLDDPAILSDLRSALSAAIEELSPEYQTVVILHDVEGLPMADVATSVGITLANAKTRLHRARLFLRKRLAAFMTPPAASRRSSPIESHAPATASYQPSQL